MSCRVCRCRERLVLPPPSAPAVSQQREASQHKEFDQQEKTHSSTNKALDVVTCLCSAFAASACGCRHAASHSCMQMMHSRCRNCKVQTCKLGFNGVQSSFRLCRTCFQLRTGHHMQLKFQDFAHVNNAEAASCAGARLISKMCNAQKNLEHHPKGHAQKRGHGCCHWENAACSCTLSVTQRCSLCAVIVLLKLIAD